MALRQIGTDVVTPDRKERPEDPGSAIDKHRFGNAAGCPRATCPAHRKRFLLVVEIMGGDDKVGGNRACQFIQQAVARPARRRLDTGAGLFALPGQDVMDNAEPLAERSDRAGLMGGVRSQAMIDGGGGQRNIEPVIGFERFGQCHQQPRRIAAAGIGDQQSARGLQSFQEFECSVLGKNRARRRLRSRLAGKTRVVHLSRQAASVRSQPWK